MCEAPLPSIFLLFLLFQPLFRVTTQQQFLKDLSDQDLSRLADVRAITQPGWDAAKVSDEHV